MPQEVSMNSEPELQARNKGRPRFSWPALAGLTLLSLVLAGCAGHPAKSGGGSLGQPCLAAELSAKQFNFARDTFAFANELTWDYGFDANGRWTGHAREPKPGYTLHCFVVARAAGQFFKFARFDPQQPAADEKTYRKLVRKVVNYSPRKRLPESKKMVIPGYADLRSFSATHERLLKEECGRKVESYFQRGHWRMIFPFSRKEQEKMAGQLLEAVNREGVAVVHVLRFPSLTINHALLLFEAKAGSKSLKFSAYDPNDPLKPLKLEFDRQSRTFVLPPTHYFPGGQVNAYQVYHRWNY